MPGFGHHQRGHIFTDLPGDQQPVGFWQVEPQRPSHPKPTGSLPPRNVAGQAQLISYPAANLVRMHISSQLLFGLRLGEPNGEALTAALKEDRSKPGRATVSFSADRKQLDKLRLWIMVPQFSGGLAYEVRVKDFVVEPERDR